MTEELKGDRNGTQASGFAQLSVAEEYITILQNKTITAPSRIQREAIPPIIAGKDVIVHSGTGTGKTLAYVLPILQRIELDSKRLQALVIVPTQELAMQIVREIESLAGSGAVIALIGGASLQRQLDKLKGHQPIAVGTPGRLVELLKLRKLKLAHIRHIVIDEVDQVFSLGAAGEVETLLKAAPRERQLLFVTATVTEQVGRTAANWMREPVTVRGETQAEATAAVTHEYMLCEYREKIDAIRRLVRTVKPVSALIFIRDTQVIGELEAKLKFAGLQIESLYGDAGKQERATVMQRFATGKLKLLIASDVAARGIDVTRISHVINFEPPIDAEQYIHRSGRTGRMGRSGTVVTLATRGEVAGLKKLTGKLGLTLRQMTLSHGEWKEAGSALPRDRKPEPAVNQNQPSKPKAVSRTAATPAPASASTPSQSKVKREPTKKERLRERERERKNKGAPRWLKEKKSHSEAQGPEDRQ